MFPLLFLQDTEENKFYGILTKSNLDLDTVLYFYDLQFI